MTDIVERLREGRTDGTALRWSVTDIHHEAASEIERLRLAFTELNAEVCQRLGKALGYPWFRDDQENFPGATEENGVCTGDHVAESIADEAADEIERLREALAAALVARGERIALMTDARSAAFESPAFGSAERFVLKGSGLVGRGAKAAAKGAREVIEAYFIRAAGATSCADKLACRKGATELLAALDAAGMQVVPKEPTEAMHNAGFAAVHPDRGDAHDGWRSQQGHQWRAMLAAAKEDQR